MNSYNSYSYNIANISGFSLKFTSFNILNRPHAPENLTLLTPSSQDDLRTLLLNEKDGVTIFVTGFPTNNSLTDIIKSYNNRNTDNLFIFDIASQLNTIEDIYTLDVDFTGNILVDYLLDIAKLTPYYNIHLIGSGVGSHVAGSAARKFYDKTGYKVRRITALDPTRSCQRINQTLFGLHRGDADFIDVIHTSSFGFGTPNALGDVDFFPNGPLALMPGSHSLVESSNLAIKYFAETVIPGQEENFMAVECFSMEHYRANKILGPKAVMGYMVTKNIKGTFFLEVNQESPFGVNRLSKRNMYSK